MKSLTTQSGVASHSTLNIYFIISIVLIITNTYFVYLYISVCCSLSLLESKLHEVIDSVSLIQYYNSSAPKLPDK